MRIAIGSDACGEELKQAIIENVLLGQYEFIEVMCAEGSDFVDVTKEVAHLVTNKEDTFGIVIDAYGQGPFMVATKTKGMVAAVVSDERTAYMTRSHNNARMICIGSEICSKTLAINIVKGFLEGHYDAGRHQIRVDMLNKMCCEV